MVQNVINEQATVLVKNAEGETVSYPMIVIGQSSVFALTKDLDLGSPTAQKYVDAIVFDFEAPKGVPLFSVSVGTRDRLQDDIVWTTPEEIPANNPIIYPRLTAKFFSLKFEDDLPLVQWKLSRIEFFGQMMVGRL